MLATTLDDAGGPFLPNLSELYTTSHTQASLSSPPSHTRSFPSPPQFSKRSPLLLRRVTALDELDAELPFVEPPASRDWKHTFCSPH